tara:strand:+ start:2515 stop:3489 length:975 start_codon:yes stop_codon:yes gene_type:complete
VIGLIHIVAIIIGAVACLVGVILIMGAPLIGERVSDNLWAVEPVSYVAVVLIITGLAIITISYSILAIVRRRVTQHTSGNELISNWAILTQQYFELFQHDLGRPLRRILGKEREVRSTIDLSNLEVYGDVLELLDEIEGQAPNFRLMMSNVQVLIQMETPLEDLMLEPVEPLEIVRRIVDRYTFAATDGNKEITWWSDPDDFGIVYCDASAIEHIVTNVVDNAVRFADKRIEIKLIREGSEFSIKVWDDGYGIPEEYRSHIFDRGWTPQLAKREERTTSGLGMFIAKTLSQRYGGDLTVESAAGDKESHYTEFTLLLPIKEFSG